MPHSTITEATTVNKQQEDEHSSIAKTQSMFNDIKQVLKAVEESKSKIDTRLSELNRQRENKLFYNKNIFNNHENENGEQLLGVDEQRRTRKLVDGCISAITTDVQRIVEQKLIDESRHVKLVAEKDTNPTNMSTKAKRVSSFPLRTRSVDKQPTTLATTSQTKKYLNQIYGPTFLAQLKREEQEKKQKELREQQQQQQQQQQAAENLKRQQQTNLARTKKNALPKQTKSKTSSPSPPPQKLSSSNSATAFFTIPFKSFSQRSRSTSHEKSTTPPPPPRQPKHVITNVGLVNIITSDSHPHPHLPFNDEPLKELKRQVR